MSFQSNQTLFGSQAQQGLLLGLQLPSCWLLPGSVFFSSLPRPLGPHSPTRHWLPSHPTGYSSKAIASRRPPAGPHCLLRASSTTPALVCPPRHQLGFCSLACLPAGRSSHKAGTFFILLVHPSIQHGARCSVLTWYVNQCGLPGASELRVAELALEPRTSSSLCKLHGAILLTHRCVHSLEPSSALGTQGHHFWSQGKSG
ncbi:hypothetical protein HJG60_011239 [Phyllostomus discolor]|uniref:Uncharacterized protein n=1 Tax=Phyllostomus discolor TaxID=89673 RepID=A0A834E581_9CHIR|nr:hypothetical protein HJG60_011239 [Phyllostomus discolor]